MRICAAKEKIGCSGVNILYIRWPRSVTTHFKSKTPPKVHNTFPNWKHNSIIAKNTFECSQHICKLETQFDNCSKHISIFTTHFTLENKTIENTFQHNHTTKIEIEKTFQFSKYWQHMETSANAVTGREGSATHARNNHCKARHSAKKPPIFSI